MNYLKYALIAALIFLQACKEESCSKELYSDQDQYFFHYNKGRLFAVINNLLEEIDEQDRDVISLKHFDKIDNLFHGASVGGEHTFESYFSIYGGLSRDNLSINIKFEIDSIRFAGEALIDTESRTSNFILKIKEEATIIWEDQCLMNSKLAFLDRIDGKSNNAYLCDQKITITLTLNEKSTLRVFKDTNLRVFSPSEQQVPSHEN